jgi:hypothetical protein
MQTGYYPVDDHLGYDARQHVWLLDGQVLSEEDAVTAYRQITTTIAPLKLIQAHMAGAISLGALAQGLKVDRLEAQRQVQEYEQSQSWAPQKISPETAAAARRFLKELGEGKTCPHCHQEITDKQQVGRCVYANCGHRLYQGQLPKEDKK